MSAKFPFTGDEIAAERLARGLSQAQASREVGATQASWHRWECGATPRGLYAQAVIDWMALKPKYNQRIAGVE